MIRKLFLLITMGSIYFWIATSDNKENISSKAHFIYKYIVMKVKKMQIEPHVSKYTKKSNKW